jgi:hypothetical protein
MDVGSQMTKENDQLHKRIDKIEQLINEEALTLVEILANITFFGDLKKTKCEYAKNGQCGFFILINDTKGKIPIATDCRIEQCKETAAHCHIELSNISCALCEMDKERQILSESKLIKRNQVSYRKQDKRNRK